MIRPISLVVVITLLITWCHGQENDSDGNQDSVEGDPGNLDLYSQEVQVSQAEYQALEHVQPHIGELNSQSGVPGGPTGARGENGPQAVSTYYRSGDNSCWLNGRWVQHGTEAPLSQVNPCWTKLCWYGRLVDRGDGCHYEGQCRPIGRTFRYECSELFCSKSNLGGGRYYYSVTISRRGCQDATRSCRRTGERNFPAYIQGRYYRNCMCKPNGATMCFNDWY